MALQPFTWGMGGQKITTPEQAKRQREVAAALIKRNPSENWAQGLGSVTAALASNAIGDRAAQAEMEGQQRAGGLFSGLAVNADPNSIIAAMTSPDAAWASPAQTSIASALLNSGLERQDPMYQAQLAKLQAEAANGGQGSESFFGTPIYTQDAEGNISAGQLGNQGTFNSIQLPEGQSLAPVTKEIDTGTEIITFDRNGNELFRTPKNVRQAAYEAGFGGVEGKTEAENIAAAESIASKLPGLRGVVAQLGELAKTATYTQTGQLIDNIIRETGQEPSDAAIARAQYVAMVDNQVLPLLRDTFGAAFTQKEGETLRATLGNPNASPAEKQAILDAFIAQKERDVAGMMSNMPGSSPIAPAGGSGGYTVLGVE